MRIDLTGIREPQDAERPEQSSGRARGGVGPAGALADDKAEISLDQVRVQALVAQASRVPDVRQQRVAALGRAIQQGSYEVSPEQTAEAMLTEIAPRFAA
jgi:flagellar biosynthesis anti-sigma factor FlgM